MLAVNNGDGFIKNGLEPSSHAPTDLQLAETFGGGSEYFSCWRLPLRWFSFIRWFEQEEE